MNTEIFNFKVGAFNCKAISDGTMIYAPPIFPPPATLLCVNAPKEDLSKLLIQQGQELQKWKEWVSTYTCLFIDTSKYRVLVDTGAGRLGANTGKLIPNLQKAGITPEDIDIVILTHAHPDHVGGNMNPDGKPVFSKSRWILSKNEWQFWTSGLAEQKLAEHSKDVLINIARSNLIPIKDRIDFIDKEAEIIPGISAIAAPGHTPGQMALCISSEGKQLIYLSDVVLHPFHLAKPEWYAAVDTFPEHVVKTRHSILNRVTNEKALVMAFHFPFPGLGYVIPNKKTWSWQSPIS